MKKIISILTIIFLLTLFACKKECNKRVTIIRDCTGTYIRLDAKDYHVCNLEKVSSFANDAIVTVTFKKIKECNNSANASACYVNHANEGWIEIDKIK